MVITALLFSCELHPKHYSRDAENVFSPNISRNLCENFPKILRYIIGLHKTCIILGVTDLEMCKSHLQKLVG